METSMERITPLWGKITKAEEKVFRNLRNIKVVFDVGARDNVDYLEIKPRATYHLFEPNPDFFRLLKENVGGRKNVYLNNFGLGDNIGNFPYNITLQAFGKGQLSLPITTLDEYIKKNKIKRIDFLKIDAELWDYKVLLGGKKAIKMARYIQYETGNEPENTLIKEMLKKDFKMKEIGDRNIFCTRKWK